MAFSKFNHKAILIHHTKPLLTKYLEGFIGFAQQIVDKIPGTSGLNFSPRHTLPGTGKGTLCLLIFSNASRHGKPPHCGMPPEMHHTVEKHR
jgi:hypothetical protein